MSHGRDRVAPAHYGRQVEELFFQALRRLAPDGLDGQPLLDIGLADHIIFS
jgi:hypothetical protein